MTIISCLSLHLECKLHQKRLSSVLFIHTPSDQHRSQQGREAQQVVGTSGTGRPGKTPSGSFYYPLSEAMLPSSLLCSWASWACLSLEPGPPLTVSGCPPTASACAQFEPPHSLTLQQGLSALAPTTSDPSQPFLPGLWPGQQQEGLWELGQVKSEGEVESGRKS